MSELVDEHDLGSCAARRRSSSLLFPSIRDVGTLEHLGSNVVSCELDDSDSQRRIDY